MNEVAVPGASHIGTSGPYKLIDTSGEVIKSGPGVLSYNEAVGLYYLMSPDFFVYLDSDGNEIIRIPLMSYILD